MAADENFGRSVRQYLDGLNALDIDRVIDAFDPDAVIRYPGLEVMGPKGFRGYLEHVVSVLSAFHIEDKEMFSSQHGVGARWTFDATTKAGRVARCEGIDSWALGTDGKIQNLDVYYDPSPLLQALQG